MSRHQVDVSTISNGLSIAAEKFGEHADMFRQIAASIRAGEEVSMFAEGEAGAVAADRLAEQFDRQHKDTRLLAELFMDADRAFVVVEDDDEGEYL